VTWQGFRLSCRTLNPRELLLAVWHERQRETGMSGGSFKSQPQSYWELESFPFRAAKQMSLAGTRERP